jgi:predicted AAA+ superfamily ATPase
MRDQIEQIIRDKIIEEAAREPLRLTRRDLCAPEIAGKAVAVIGMRRSGKTSYLHQCRQDLLRAGSRTDQLVYFNFEDERLSGLKSNDLGLITDVHARLFPATESPLTLFLDEIQLVNGWERFVRRLLETGGYRIYLSGSSAKLLSREIATSMRGRAWEVEVYPFSFKEYLRHRSLEFDGTPDLLPGRRKVQLDGHFAAYLEIGGFPEAQTLDPTDRHQLLQGYVDTLLLRDVIERHAVSNPIALRWLTRRLLSAPASRFSVTKCADDLKSQGIRVGRETLYAFLDHLEDAYLVHAVPVATDSEKRRQVNPRKVYPADPGLIPVFDRSAKPNTGHALETAVFIELRRRRADISYVVTPSGYEVDFLTRHLDGTQELIQVSASIDDASTRARELRALAEAATQYPRAKQILLTLETRMPYPEVPPSVHVCAAWEWMQRDI